MYPRLLSVFALFILTVLPAYSGLTVGPEHPISRTTVTPAWSNGGVAAASDGRDFFAAWATSHGVVAQRVFQDGAPATVNGTLVATESRDVRLGTAASARGTFAVT